MASVPHSLLPDGAKGLVLDCDGTLMDTMSLHWQAWKLACAEFGLDITVDDFIGYAGKPGDEIARILAGQQGKALDVDAFIKWKRDWYTERLHTVKPIEPVLAIAQEAQRRGIPMAIASGGGRVHVLGAIEANSLERMFEAFICAEDYVNSKPAPDCFLLAAEKLGIAPEHCVGDGRECLVVRALQAGYEDAVLGMQAVRAAGFLDAIDVTKIPGYPELRDP